MADDMGVVSDIAELTADGDSIAAGPRPTQAQIGIAVGVAALVAVLIALVLLASRR
jgi:uncharacterized membrane protein